MHFFLNIAKKTLFFLNGAENVLSYRADFPQRRDIRVFWRFFTFSSLLTIVTDVTCLNNCRFDMIVYQRVEQGWTNVLNTNIMSLRREKKKILRHFEKKVSFFFPPENWFFDIFKISKDSIFRSKKAETFFSKCRRKFFSRRRLMMLVFKTSVHPCSTRW